MITGGLVHAFTSASAEARSSAARDAVLSQHLIKFGSVAQLGMQGHAPLATRRLAASVSDAQ